MSPAPGSSSNGSSRPAGSEVHQVGDPAELAALFGRRPEVHIYGLGDLDEPFWPASRWVRRGDAVVGVVPLPDSDITAVYAVSDADAEGTLDLLMDLVGELPVGALVTGPTGLARRVGSVRPIVDLRPHVKMALRQRALLPDAEGVRPLDFSHVGELAALHATDPGAAFWLPSMLGDDTYVGLWVDGELVSAAGTHLVSEHHSVAAIGGVITRPDQRGRGYAGRVTAGVIVRLGGRADTIGLNMVTENEPARRAYARIGFDVCWSYEEIELR
jgi:RimJ/RimL family protein N-acetyltransferase